jgi:SAM-dependent methyltransferase
MSVVTDPHNRFSSRVQAYARFRPGYPAEVADRVAELAGGSGKIIADIGSGTGIFTRMLLQRKCAVIAVEPNAPMREFAEKELYRFPLFQSADASAEATGLLPHSVDLVCAAQAFHWFDHEKTHAEFLRILRPGGKIALLWNERTDSEPGFSLDYENFIIRYSTDYLRVKHQNTANDTVLDSFFRTEWQKESFVNFQDLDFDGLKGRYDSCSYALTAEDRNYGEAMQELKSIFEKYQIKNRLRMPYETVLNWAVIG